MVQEQKIMRFADHPYRGRTTLWAIATANREGARILSNKEFDKRLVLSDTYKSERECYPVWTGTFCGYTAPNRKLGDAIKYWNPNDRITYVFEVPKEYQNEKNAILIVEHGFLADGKPILSLNEDGKNMLVEVADKGRIKFLQAFPSNNGWYVADKEYGIPLGEKVSSDNQDKHYLSRMDEEYVGLLARGIADFCYCYDNRRYVYADLQPSAKFGLLVIEPEEIIKIAKEK